MTVFLRTAILFALIACALAPAAAAAPAGNEYFPKAPSATGKDDDGGGDGGSGGSGSESGSSSDDESGSGAIGSDPGSGSGGTGSAASPEDKPKADGSIVPGVEDGTPTLPDSDSAASSSASDDEGALETLLNPLPLALIAVALIVGAGFLLRWRSGREAEGAGLRGTGRRAPPVPDPKGN